MNLSTTTVYKVSFEFDLGGQKKNKWDSTFTQWHEKRCMPRCPPEESPQLDSLSIFPWLSLQQLTIDPANITVRSSACAGPKIVRVVSRFTMRVKSRVGAYAARACYESPTTLKRPISLCIWEIRTSPYVLVFIVWTRIKCSRIRNRRVITSDSIAWTCPVIETCISHCDIDSFIVTVRAGFTSCACSCNESWEAVEDQAYD